MFHGYETRSKAAAPADATKIHHTTLGNDQVAPGEFLGATAAGLGFEAGHGTPASPARSIAEVYETMVSPKPAPPDGRSTPGAPAEAVESLGDAAVAAGDAAGLAGHAAAGKDDDKEVANVTISGSEGFASAWPDESVLNPARPGGVVAYDAISSPELRLMGTRPVQDAALSEPSVRSLSAQERIDQLAAENAKNAEIMAAQSVALQKMMAAIDALQVKADDAAARARETAEDATTKSAEAIAGAMLSVMQKYQPPKVDSGVNVDVLGGVVFDFMAASEHDMLRNFVTEITPAVAFGRMPNPNSRDDSRQFYSKMGASTLMSGFNDDVTHAKFVVLRNTLLADLAGLAYHTILMQGSGFSSKEQAVAMARSTAARYMNDAIKHQAGISKKMSVVNIQISALESTRKGEEVTVKYMVGLLEKEYVAATPFALQSEIHDRIKSITFERGYTPSSMVIELQTVLLQRWGPDHKARIEDEVRAHVMQNVGALVETHPAMRAINDKIMDISFSKAPLDEWVVQFKNYESQESFRAALAAIATAGSTGGRKVASKQVATNGVAAMMGNHPREFDEDDDQEPPTRSELGALREILGSLAGLAPKDLQSNGAPSTAERDLLRRLIAAVGEGLRSEPPRYDAAWVAAEGVPGYAPPDDKDRPPLHIGKVCKALGWTIDPGCPKDPRALVGPTCVCNTNVHHLDASQWFYHPKSQEFKSGKAEFCRPVPPDLTTFGYYHGFGKCKHVAKAAHKHVKANPASVDILTPLPRGVKDCVTIV